jgi:thiol-disulfide isomerase/thioredoxin
MPELQAQIGPVKQYYLAHGGTEERWTAWATSAPAVTESAPKPLSFATQLPEFSATDLNQRAWSLGDLKGKATLVVFWATWCGPCRGELPAIQELYDRIKDRKDLEILTISVDEDAVAAREYIHKNKYSFPVIVSGELADKLFPWAGLPTGFLVSPKGARTSYYAVGIDSASVTHLIDVLAGIAAKRE